jgi:CMP-N-acetylneuraminic acid synthetase
MSWPSARGALAVLAVVPARGGSKGLPGKNLKPVGGISLVGRAARLARSLDWIDHAVLSTDDATIAAEGARHGLDVPFMRPAELASDTASSADMWRHAWLASEAHFGRRFDVSLLLEPTSPLRRADDLAATMAALVDGGHRSAATVSRTPAHYTAAQDADGRRCGSYRLLLDRRRRFRRAPAHTGLLPPQWPVLCSDAQRVDRRRRDHRWRLCSRHRRSPGRQYRRCVRTGTRRMAAGARVGCDRVDAADTTRLSACDLDNALGAHRHGAVKATLCQCLARIVGAISPL